jgi:hypothetical protein
MTRIVFNGQEYASREAMPDDVRREYEEALAMLQTSFPGMSGPSGVSGDHTVISVQRNTSVSFSGAGSEALPAPVRRLVESALSGGTGRNEHRGGTEEPDPLQTFMGIGLAFMAGFVFVFAIVLLFAIGGGRSQLAGRLSVAVAALLFLGWLDGMATRLARRRESLLGPDSPGYRRFVVWSAAGLATAAVLLLGIAWYL